MDKYLISVTNTYRVPTVEDALKLRNELQETDCGELTKFSYNTKYVKSTDEEYQIVKATIDFNDPKDPEQYIKANYEVEF